MRPASSLMLLGATVVLATPALAQRRAPRATVSADSLRARLFALAHDSMGGRDTGSPGNFKAAEWVAATFQRYGLEPAGDNGTWFQVIPFLRTAPDARVHLRAPAGELAPGSDYIVTGGRVRWSASGSRAIWAGVASDSATWPDSAAVSGKLVVFGAPRGLADFRGAVVALNGLRRHPRFVGAAGWALVALDLLASDLLDQVMQGGVSTDTTPLPTGKPGLLITPRAATVLLGADPATARPGLTGGEITGDIAWARTPLQYAARNVVGILRGGDPALRNTFVSTSGHNDHVGYTRGPVDHDSTRAFNRVVRPMGADSRMRPPTPDEATRIAALRDSLRAAHPPRQDSIFNGADDDGTGTVALMELARVLSSGPRPRRSILFVNHAAEERGLLGSRWYTDHPTVPLDSVIAEIDEDMIGRGGADDLPGGGPAYLEVVGARRLSNEFGDTLEAVSARLPVPFRFNYEYDAPGHPLQYYCRADHYSYARYGIPSVAFSRGEHMDYHQVTDEAQYIDYANYARVVTLVEGALRAIANMDHRPAVTGPRGDPHGPCRQ